jgi:hypothetical protein
MVKEHVEEVPTSAELLLGNEKDPDSTVCTLNAGAEMYKAPTEAQIIDLYTVGSEEPEEFKINPLPEVPFVHSIALNGTNSGIVCTQGVFNSGVMVNTMCSSVYESIKHKLPALRASKRRL